MVFVFSPISHPISLSYSIGILRDRPSMETSTMGDNGLAFLNDTNNTMNLTGGMFNCLSDNISSTSITDRSHWEIQENLKYGTPYVATVVLIFFLLSFFWNLFIIITYFVKYKLLKQPANIFLLNLAIADLLVAVTTILFSTVTTQHTHTHTFTHSHTHTHTHIHTSCREYQ